MWQVFVVVNPPTRAFLLSWAISKRRHEAVTCTLRLKKAHWTENENFDEVKYQEVIDFIREEIDRGT